MSNKPKVELLTAFYWICDECGLANYGVPEHVEMTDEEREDAYRMHHALSEWAELPEGWRQFELVETPTHVTCQHCKLEFEVDSE